MRSIDPNICSLSNLITFTNPEIILENSDYGRTFELDWKIAILTLTYRSVYKPLSILFANKLQATGQRKKLRPWKRTVLYHRLALSLTDDKQTIPHIQNNVCQITIMETMPNCEVIRTSFLDLLLYGGLLATIRITSAMQQQTQYHECKMVFFFPSYLNKNQAMGK